nr:hypothetical protein Iba_chr13cCG11690 [Ipomoea batatas]
MPGIEPTLSSLTRESHTTTPLPLFREGSTSVITECSSETEKEDRSGCVHAGEEHRPAADSSRRTSSKQGRSPTGAPSPISRCANSTATVAVAGSVHGLLSTRGEGLWFTVSCCWFAAARGFTAEVQGRESIAGSSSPATAAALEIRGDDRHCRARCRRRTTMSGRWGNSHAAGVHLLSANVFTVPLRSAAIVGRRGWKGNHRQDVPPPLKQREGSTSVIAECSSETEKEDRSGCVHAGEDHRPAADSSRRTSSKQGRSLTGAPSPVSRCANSTATVAVAGSVHGLLSTRGEGLWFTVSCCWFAAARGFTAEVQGRESIAGSSSPATAAALEIRGDDRHCRARCHRRTTMSGRWGNSHAAGVHLLSANVFTVPLRSAAIVGRRGWKVKEGG